jgi:alkyl hydroperoxide reductase subunit F
MYDVIIIGGGPAAVGAGVYAARKKLKTLMIAESFGGQSITSDKIENWIGDVEISGFDLSERLEKHVRAQKDIEIKTGERATKIEASNCTDGVRVCDFTVTCEQGSSYASKAIILAAGARRRRTGVPGEDKLEGKGVAFCATCDAPLFSGKQVAVIGGGNAGLESVIDLVPYASKVFLLVRSDTMKGDMITQEEIKKYPQVEIIFNAQAKEFVGEQFMTGLIYTDTRTNEEKKLPVEGVFIEIGSVPNSEMAKGLVDINAFGEVVIDAKTAATSHPGIFAAGDITDDIYKQNNISVGDGIRAALSAYNYILQIKKSSPAAEVV